MGKILQYAHQKYTLLNYIPGEKYICVLCRTNNLNNLLICHTKPKPTLICRKCKISSIINVKYIKRCMDESWIHNIYYGTYIYKDIDWGIHINDSMQTLPISLPTVYNTNETEFCGRKISRHKDNIINLHYDNESSDDSSNESENSSLNTQISNIAVRGSIMGDSLESSANDSAMDNESPLNNIYIVRNRDDLDIMNIDNLLDVLNDIAGENLSIGRIDIPTNDAAEDDELDDSES